MGRGQRLRSPIVQRPVRTRRHGLRAPPPPPPPPPPSRPFSFNSPQGACPKCEGFGHVIGISEDLVIPDPSKSVYDNCVAPWRGEKASRYKQRVLQNAYDEDFPVHTPYADLTAKQRRQLWNGTRSWRGIDDFFAALEAKSYKIQNRVMLSRYRGKTACAHCGGSRLKPEAGYVRIDGHALPDCWPCPSKRCCPRFKN